MQNEYSQKLSQFHSAKKRMPTYAEMMQLFGFKSKNAVYRLVTKLLDAGLVAKDHLGRLIPVSGFGEIAVLGTVKAGFPAEAEQQVLDTVSLEDMLVEKKESTYLLTVDGNSMIDAHIADGDLVLAERTSQANDKDIVIAEVDGEFTMKHFRKQGSKVWLEPANKDFNPIYPTQSLEIKAIVKAVIRKLH